MLHLFIYLQTLSRHILAFKMVNSPHIPLFWLFLKAISPVSGEIQTKRFLWWSQILAGRSHSFPQRNKSGLLGIWLTLLSEGSPNENSVMCLLQELGKRALNSRVWKYCAEPSNGICPVPGGNHHAPNYNREVEQMWRAVCWCPSPLYRMTAWRVVDANAHSCWGLLGSQAGS